MGSQLRLQFRTAPFSTRGLMTAAATTQGIRFERATGIVGAWVHGVALDGPHPPATAEALHRALHEYGVLFFDFGNPLTAAAFAAFGEVFGEPEEGYRFTVG